MGGRKQQGWGRQGPPLELPTHPLKAYPRSHLLCVPCALMSYRKCRARWGLSLCPQTVFIQRLSQSRGSGDIHGQLPCNHRTETSHPGPRGRGRRYSALWNHSSEPSFHLGMAPWKDRLCYALVSIRGDKKTCRRQTEPMPAESLDGRSMLGKLAPSIFTIAYAMGILPSIQVEKLKPADFREEKKARILTSNASGNPKILAQDSAGSQEL